MDKINKKFTLKTRNLPTPNIKTRDLPTPNIKTRDLPTPNIKTFADHTPRPHGKQIIYV